MKTRNPISSAIGLVLVLVSAAQAQTGKTGADESGFVDEIIVTAQRREQSLGDVSIAITVLDSNDIVASRVDDPTGLARLVPTLQIKSVFSKSNPQVFMRGVGVNDDTALTSGSVAMYSDEAFLGAPASQLFPIFDLERIEVLRGPQGTLYGRNTTGGAINFISRRPGEKLETSLRLGFGRFGGRTFEGAIGGPASDNFGVRAAFVVNQRDGYMRNRHLDTDDAEVGNWAARLILDYAPTDNTTVSLKLHGGSNDAQARQYTNQGLMDPDSVAAGTPALCATPGIVGTCSDLFGYIDDSDPNAGRWDRRGDEEVDMTGADLTISSRLDDLGFTSISAVSKTDRDVRPDTDASPNQVLHIDWLDSTEQFSQEFRLTSPPDSTHRWIVGAYYLDQSISIDQTNDAFRELRPIFGFDPSRLVIMVNTRIDQDLESTALFGQLDYALSERTTLVAGLRYTDEKRDIVRLDALTEPAFTIPLVDLGDSVSSDNLSGKLGIEYRDRADNLMYVSATSGFKSGGFNGAVALDPGSVPPFDEETLATIELGYKWSRLDGKLGINAAGFYTDYQDLQVFTRQTSGGIPREILTNAADARVLGAELELLAIPTDSLELRLGIGLLDTELKDYQTDVGEDFSGNKLVGAPNFSLNGMLLKSFELERGTLALQANYHYQDDVFFETSNNPLLAQDAYGLLDGRISFSSPDGDWEVALWGRNLTDERYLLGVVGLGAFGYNLQSWGEPLTWGVDVTWHR